MNIQHDSVQGISTHKYFDPNPTLWKPQQSSRNHFRKKECIHSLNNLINFAIILSLAKLVIQICCKLNYLFLIKLYTALFCLFLFITWNCMVSNVGTCDLIADFNSTFSQTELKFLEASFWISCVPHIEFPCRGWLLIRIATQYQ
jgi:hypothetical protein